MNLTLTRPICIIDTETTGVLPSLDQIVQIAFRRYDPATPDEVDVYCSKVKPSIPIPAEASAIHGITDADVAQDTPSFAALAPYLYKRLAGCDLAGKRVKFDRDMVNEAFLRERMPAPFGPDTRIIDLDRLWQILRPRTLEHAVREFLGRDMIEGAHDAGVDVAETDAVLDAQFSELFAKGEFLIEDCGDGIRPQQTVAQMHDLCWPYPKDALDPDGKIVYRDGEARLTFGKHAGTPLRLVPDAYFHYILDKDFSPEVKALARKVLARETIGPRAT